MKSVNIQLNDVYGKVATVHVSDSTVVLSM